VENAGPGSRGTGYGIPGCGKRGVPFFSPKYDFPQ